jgi:hypothetical protein
LLHGLLKIGLSACLFELDPQSGALSINGLIHDLLAFAHTAMPAREMSPDVLGCQACLDMLKPLRT